MVSKVKYQVGRIFSLSLSRRKAHLFPSSLVGSMSAAFIPRKEAAASNTFFSWWNSWDEFKDMKSTPTAAEAKLSILHKVSRFWSLSFRLECSGPGNGYFALTNGHTPQLQLSKDKKRYFIAKECAFLILIQLSASSNFLLREIQHFLRSTFPSLIEGAGFLLQF